MVTNTSPRSKGRGSPTIKGLNIYGTKKCFVFGMNGQFYVARIAKIQYDKQAEQLVISPKAKMPKKFRAEVVR